jgi:hypothetical protein
MIAATSAPAGRVPNVGAQSWSSRDAQKASATAGGAGSFDAIDDPATRAPLEPNPVYLGGRCLKGALPEGAAAG